MHRKTPWLLIAAAGLALTALVFMYFRLPQYHDQPWRLLVPLAAILFVLYSQWRFRRRVQTAFTRFTGRDLRSIDRYAANLAAEPAIRDGLKLVAAEKWSAARRSLQSAVSTVHDRQLVALHNQLGICSLALGDLKAARTSFQLALDRARQQHDRTGEAAALNNLAGAYTRLGLADAGLEHCRQALKAYEAADDRVSAARAHLQLGLAHEYRAEPGAALEHYTAALQSYTELGLKPEQAVVHTALAGVHEGQGQSGKAQQHYEIALGIHRATGNREEEAQTLGDLANLAAEQGQKALAVEHLLAARRIAATLADPAVSREVTDALRTLREQMGSDPFFTAAARYGLSADEAAALQRELGGRSSGRKAPMTKHQ